MIVDDDPVARDFESFRFHGRSDAGYRFLVDDPLLLRPDRQMEPQEAFIGCQRHRADTRGT